MLKTRLKYYFIWLIAILLHCSNLALAQNPVSVKYSSGKILIGDQINVWLTFKEVNAKLPPIKWPVLPDTIPGFVWIQIGKLDTFTIKDTVVIKQKFTLTSFDSGSYYIPSFTFVVTSAKGQQVFHTDSLPVVVQTISVDTAKAFMPIKGVQDIPITWQDYWQQIVLGLAGIVLIVLLLFYFLKWRKKRADKLPFVSPEKAHERALRLLGELKEKQLWQSGAVKAYYESLSQIIRAYLEHRFDVVALERTTDELLRETHKMVELKAFRKQLRMILQTADLAKFARANPLPEEHENCMQAAEELVAKTKMITTKEEADK